MKLAAMLPSSSTQALPLQVRRLLERRMNSAEFELPFLPDTTAEVLALCNDEGCEVKELAGTMQRDQSLAAHVIRLANSAAYAPKEPIVSLQQTISRLGLGTIREIAIAVSLKARVFDVPGHLTRIRRMWMHSAACGVYAREVARLVRHNVEGAFMCGLLHDVGKPIVMQTLIDVARQRTERPVPAAMLDAAMSEYHTRLGGRLAVHWNMPEWVVEAVRCHHDYAMARVYHMEAMITYLADRLAHWALDDSLSEEDFASEDPVVDDLGIYADDLVRLFHHRDTAIEVAESFLT